MEIAETSSKEKPSVSYPVFEATSKEYTIAVNTPNHSKILVEYFF